MLYNLRSTGNIAGLTATAGTAIMGVIPPPENRRLIARITSLIYVSGATAHTISFMKALAQTTLTAAADSGATTINVASTSFGAGQTLAASDFAVIRLSVATGYIYQILAVSGVSTLALTVTALATAAPSGSKVWLFGTASEANAGIETLSPTASTRTIYSNEATGIATAGYKVEVSDVVYQRSGRGDPMIIHSGNGTNAGTFENISYGHFAT